MTLDEYLKKNRVRQSCLATLAGCSQSMISLVTTGRSQLSPEKVLRIAEATNFEVTPHELRPDNTYGAEEDDGVNHLFDPPLPGQGRTLWGCVLGGQKRGDFPVRRGLSCLEETGESGR